MKLILITQFITILLNVALGSLVLYKNHRSRTHWYFWIFTLGVAGLNLSLFMMFSGAGDPMLWGKLAFSLASLMPTGLSLFAASFPWPDKQFKLEKFLILATGVLFLILPLIIPMVRDDRVVDNGFENI